MKALMAELGISGYPLSPNRGKGGLWPLEGAMCYQIREQQGWISSGWTVANRARG